MNHVPECDRVGVAAASIQAQIAKLEQEVDGLSASSLRLMSEWGAPRPPDVQLALARIDGRIAHIRHTQLRLTQLLNLVTE